MALGMNARPHVLPELIEQVGQELDWLDHLLAKQGNRLGGGQFGRADLTAASLLAPIVLPQVEPVKSLSVGINWPNSLAPSISAWLERPSLKWVRYMYETYRGVRGPF
jgi:glutathione S-transferase